MPTDNHITPCIPEVKTSDSILEAALLYAEAGLYILPIQHGTKNPGSVVGAGWPQESSNSKSTVEKWFTGTDYGIALHAGRSNLIVFDIDHEDYMPQILIDAIKETTPPAQQSRPGRAHFLFAQPPGRMLGNSAGALARGWGEVRGKNGVIVCAPTLHPDGTGQYQWLQTGLCPVLPETVAQHISEAGPTARAANSKDVDKFLEEYRAENKPNLLKSVTTSFAEKVMLKNMSRHEVMTDHLCWAMQEAKAGYYPAKLAYRRLLDVFINSLKDEYSGSGRKADTWQAEREFQDIAKWVIGQVNALTDKKLHARAERLDQVDEKQRLKEAVDRQKFNLKVRRLARNELDVDTWTEPTDGGRMDEVLQKDHKKVPHRIDGLGKVGGNTTLAGQYKAGKTTMEQNLIRSLVDNVPFIGREVVTPLEGNVGVFNYELDADEFIEWLNELGIVNQEKIFILNLRGENLPLLSEHGAEWTSKWLHLRDIEYWIIDPAVRALSRQGDEVSNADVNAFTEALDNIKADSGVKDLLLLTHTGRLDNGRTRGASRWDDWPDSLWSLNKKGNKRFFSAFGRKVDVEEMELVLDRTTNRLSPADPVTPEGVPESERILVDQIIKEVRMNPGKKSEYYFFKLAGAIGRKVSLTEKENALEEAVMLERVKAVEGNKGTIFYFPGTVDNTIIYS